MPIGARAFQHPRLCQRAALELNSDPPIMMAQLLMFAQQQIRHAFSTRRDLPVFVIEQEVSIPEGYADLGDRQLNEILSSTRYHIRRRHAFDDLQNQYSAARAFQSSSDVRDAPGGSRGRSVPVQPKEPPTLSQPLQRLRRSLPMPRKNGAARSSTTSATSPTPMSPDRPTSLAWTACSGLAWRLPRIRECHMQWKAKPSPNSKTSTTT